MMKPLAAAGLSKSLGRAYSLITLAGYRLRRFGLRHGYYELKYRRLFGRVPDYADPRTFSDKLAWRRLYDHNPLYPYLVDKIAVRRYVRERAGEEVLVPLYGVWETAAEIQFDSLPEQFAMKCNHESGFVILCRDRSRLDRDFVRAQLATRLRMNFYYKFLEWPYHDVTPRILAEELLVDEHGGKPIVYRFHCFQGIPRFIFTEKERPHRPPICAYYSPAWELTPFTSPGYGVPAEILPRPPSLEKMLEVAAALSRGLNYCRVDLYNVRGKVYFGEITLIPAAGFFAFEPSWYNDYWGECFVLPMGRPSP